MGSSVSHPLRRAAIPQRAPSTPSRGRAAAAPILQLQGLAGNRAVTRLVLQRAVGWTDVSPEGKKGYDWNSDERPVGKVRRIPLEGLKEGTGASLKPKEQKGWHDIPALSSEHAIGKAIVLVPEGLNAKDSIEVVVFLHGHTEGTHRPFAGFRTLDKAVPGAGKHMQDLRRGIDAKDVAPVRDVALDQAEGQLEDSQEKQLVIVIPQGGLTSQFSKAGGKDFDARPYVNEIVTRLQTEKKWMDDTGGVAAAAPSVTRIVMAGHSGAGAALSHMADADKPGVKPGDSSAHPRRPRDLRRDQRRQPAHGVRGVGEAPARAGLRDPHRPHDRRHGQARPPQHRAEAARLHDRLLHRSVHRARQGDRGAGSPPTRPSSASGRRACARTTTSSTSTSTTRS